MNYIPEKLPKGTTLEQWERYAVDMARHEEYYQKTKPTKAAYGYIGGMPPDAEHERAYENAYSEWHMNYSCFEPNKPGYYRANND